MRIVLVILLWLILFALFWPLALLALVLVPVMWLLAIPFRLVFWVFEAMLRLLKSILFLPARLLGDKEAVAAEV
ncbi:MAG TPA: hypothetical protein VM735_04195 [Candidatus Kapabacteria bacterium]|nr:hypothetical protein [Candidatus Kapabacteria bacterium]